MVIYVIWVMWIIEFVDGLSENQNVNVAALDHGLHEVFFIYQQQLRDVPPNTKVSSERSVREKGRGIMNLPVFIELQHTN